MKKLRKQLSSQKGESLIESLISIVIFSLLIATVTLTIATALRITAQATDDADAAQGLVNQIILGNPDAFNGDDTIEFGLTFQVFNRETGVLILPEELAPEAQLPITVTYSVDINTEPSRLAFRLEE